MKTLVTMSIIILIVTALGLQVAAQDEETGYFDRPQVYIDDDIYIPTAILGSRIPPENYLMWNFSSAYVSSSEFRWNGNEVQRNLGVRLWSIRASAEKLFGETSLGISVPVGINEISGRISGMPASSDGYKLGDISIIGKRSIWKGEDGSNVTVGAAIELPTGVDDMRFDQSNSMTNAYYTGYTQRLPLAWQPGSGSTDLMTSIAYSKTGYRKAYEAILACKFNGKGDDDVRLGNRWILSLNATHAIGPDLAASFGLTYINAKNDSYPNAPYPGIDQPALAGTVQHGSSLSFSPSLRYRTKHNLTIGLSLSVPVIKPDDGLVSDSRWGIIVSL